MREPLSPQYDPGAIETSLYRHWDEQGYFHADAGAVRERGADPYVIVIPPPNVTAVLHMGHGLNNTMQDVLIRWQRMRGREALYLPGTDHAGIATQNVVERIIAAEGSTRAELGRDAFLERVWSFVNETGSTILQQLRAIGCSCDWSRTRFTLEPALSRAVREAFVRLYEKGLIYRGNYIINWCPRCLTALSDEEAEGEPAEGSLYRLRYPLAEPVPGLPTLPDGRSYIVVATTRPETMLGDTAVAVHPEDERYRAIAGHEVLLPLAERRIPVVADDFVDREFGTGAVKITPAHDPNDFAMAQRHGIRAVNVMTPDAHLNEDVPEAFRGLERFEARAAVVAALRAADLLDGIEPHAHTLPHCYRCDTIVEPRLSEQWFVRMRPLAEPALAAARAGKVRFTPERHAKVYEHWLENIRDWCISRQLWWGHRIPVFYCQAPGCGKMIVARDDPQSCEACGSTELRQDPDVLDTWFSSWLWPFSTEGWPEETADLAAFYPTHTLVTAPEILFFWVARMIMSGIEFMGEVPFADVYLTGTVRDMEGRKMSKSLGNGIDPLEVVRLYGADALRYTVVAGSGLGTDVRMDPNDLETTFAVGRNFTNKVWNAGRFALMNVAGDDVADVSTIEQTLELSDRWILSRIAAASEEITRNLESFRFHEAAEAGYHCFRGELADWYLEVIKPRVQPDAPAASRAAAEATLVAALDGILRLLHPVMPFITEALWQRLPAVRGRTRAESIMKAPWPEAGEFRRDRAAEAEFAELMELIGTIRALRSEYNIPPGTPLVLVLSNVSAALAGALAQEKRAVGRLARIAEIRSNGGSGAGAHAVLRSGVELFLPLEGVIDIERERQRLGSELTRLEGQLRGTEAKLANEQFTARAPDEVVARERARAESCREQRDRLAAKLAALS
jgi:valyl-tRNA synthetase